MLAHSSNKEMRKSIFNTWDSWDKSEEDLKKSLMT